MIISVMGFLLLLLFLYIGHTYENNIQKTALKGLDLQLSGVIDSVSKFNGYNGFGIIDLRILSSNMKYYDPRNEKKNYYCIIKNFRAEIYDGHADEMYTGDTIHIDTGKKLISWRKGKENFQYIIWVNTDKTFNEIIKKHTRYF